MEQIQSRRGLRRVDLVGNQEGLGEHQAHVLLLHIRFLGQAGLGLILVVHDTLHIVDGVVVRQIHQQQHEFGAANESLSARVQHVARDRRRIDQLDHDILPGHHSDYWFPRGERIGCDLRCGSSQTRQQLAFARVGRADQDRPTRALPRYP